MKRVALPLVVLACGMLVWAACSRRHNGDAFLPSSPEFSGALVLSVSASSIPANGFSRVEITAQITGGADLDKRQVRFSTDNGDFLAADGTSAGKTRDAEVNSTGAVTIVLRSSTAPGLATITAQALDTSNANNPVVIQALITRITVEFTPADASGIIQLSASADRGEADEATVIFIHADIAPEFPIVSPVNFVTTLGSFINGTVDPTDSKKTAVNTDIGRRATAALQSPATAGEALVTATIDQTTAEIRIPFDPALPEVILVNLGAAKLASGGPTETTITVKMSRSEGKVTTGTAVHYSAFEKEYGKPLDLLFRDQELSNDMEEATAKVALGTVAFVGTATIRARVGDVRGEADIEIDAPADESDIKADKGILAFGDRAVGTSTDDTVTITNDASATGSVTVTKISISGRNRSQFSTPAKPAVPIELDPGESFVVTVRFSPTSTGSKSASLQISSNDPDKPVLSISLTGTGI